ncbi:hypothetical protein Lesp02_67300 [Lentzea sp. NBRC 105346]|uniref:DUF4129 domain-containing protein n=1 Tax=Lentzea sp. NBRC 105346 TaxID=3032205 RepID=UPI0024A2803F|nr:DUF4129 domain-containing protein [Lentzea sp. NBRC 105346]GLZ34543.1 hypothetical protein Lesp02_67300 [Lentzea sp. NBRC 105346]
MRARVGVVVAALLLVIIAARGRSPVVFHPPPKDPDVRDTLTPGPQAPQSDVSTEGSGVPFLILLLVVAGFVVFGLIGMALAISFTRRRTRGERGVEIVERETPAAPSFQHQVARALIEIRSDRPPKDAVIAAWLTLEEAHPREPHQTPTEFTTTLPADTKTLRELYQRARFSDEPITAEHASQAERELERIIRELA